jgi:hypothetical protein
VRALVEVVVGRPPHVELDERAQGVVRAQHEHQRLDARAGMPAFQARVAHRSGCVQHCAGPAIGPAAALKNHTPRPVVVPLDHLGERVVPGLVLEPLRDAVGVEEQDVEEVGTVGREVVAGR